MSEREVVVVIGTRPELIKLAPVVLELQRRGLPHRVVSTGQHGGVLLPLFEHFGISAQVQLERSATDRGSLNALLAGLVGDLHTAVGETPSAVVVQGDTTSALAGALAGFHRSVPVVHLEAGLRTYDLASPFPEEGNRRLIGQVASLHWAPTQRAVSALVAEGVPAERILLTGNTVIDALVFTDEKTRHLGTLPRQGRTVLVTAHRRESWGEGLDSILRGVLDAARSERSSRFLWVAHPNPALRARVDAALGGEENIEVLDPLPYPGMVAALRSCSIVLTDSGGLQEEAPSFNKPVLVMRDTTERPEAVETGCARLIGTAAGAITDGVLELLRDRDAYLRMSHQPNPFGDGRSAIPAVDSLVAKGLCGIPVRTSDTP